MDFKIRNLSHSDCSDLLACEKAIFLKPWSSSALAFQLQSATGFNLGCFYDNNLVAYLLANEIYIESELLRLGTLEVYRTKGIAKKMLEAYFKMSLSKTFFLEVEDSNKIALSLYRKYGYQIYYERKDYYGPKHNALLMKREIK